MTWKLRVKYICARVKHIFVRTYCCVPLSLMIEAKERLGINLPIDEETVRETAGNKDPFPCARCGEKVQTSSVEISDLSTYVIQSIRRGHCQRCGMAAEFENRFYEGQMAAKVAMNGWWRSSLPRESIEPWQGCGGGPDKPWRKLKAAIKSHLAA